MVTVDTEYIEVSADDPGDVCTLELANPDKLNALNPEMVEGLASAFEQLHEDPGPCVLIDGQGRVTCAGMDRDIVAGGDYGEQYPDLDERLGELYTLVADYPRPVAVAGRGALIGAAAILSFCAEFVVLDEEANVAVPEVTYDIPSERITTLLPDVAPWRVAAEMALTGEPIDPERAYEVGLANDVLPADEVTPRARELLETVAGNDEETVAQLTKQLRESRSQVP
jgi:enoyl-CoA hydratase/carnithine racemase